MTLILDILGERSRRRLLSFHILTTDFTSVKYKKGLELASQEFRISILYKTKYPVRNFIDEMITTCEKLSNSFDNNLNRYTDMMYELS